MKTIVLVLPSLLLGLACKREPRPAGPGDTGTATPVGGAEPAEAVGDAAGAAADLPPPSEALGPVPEALAAAVTLVEIADGLARPVDLTFAPGDPRRRLFVLEQHVGRIRVIEGGQVAAAPYLDLRGKVSTANEQGLLGLAFHPRFPDNRRLFVSYTDRDNHTRIVEYRVPAVEADAVDPGSARELFFQKQPYANHNGGDLLFGPDGKLYLGLGDGGAANDPLRAGQDPATPLAKLLRFDVDAWDGAARMTPEIVARGLRNPWRNDFDPATGDLYIGDVGQNEWEWIHVVPAGTVDGRNFGWNVVEGRACFRKPTCDKTGFTLPVVVYGHDEGCSITGGVVYRGKALPELAGVYFYADYCTALLRSFRWAEDGVRQHWDWKPVLDPEARLSQISSFGRDEEGEVYLLGLGGTIWKLAPR
jgi:glucose/arabinose dehydrogenase